MKSLIYLLLAFIVILTSNYSCIRAQNNTSDSDSAAFAVLIKKMLKWHEADRSGDFLMISNPKDTVYYSGLDWTANKKRMRELFETNFFTKDFLENYQAIALHLDKELKQNKIKYRIGELPPYGNEANEWCNCQDYPSNIWQRLQITNIKIDNDTATFQWTWGDNFYYSVNTKKENGSWKISYLERFDIKNFTW